MQTPLCGQIDLFACRRQQAPFQGAGSQAQTQAFGATANQIFSSYLGEPRTYGLTLRSRF